MPVLSEGCLVVFPGLGSSLVSVGGLYYGKIEGFQVANQQRKYFCVPAYIWPDWAVRSKRTNGSHRLRSQGHPYLIPWADNLNFSVSVFLVEESKNNY